MKRQTGYYPKQHTITLFYGGEYFEVDIDGLCKWLDSSPAGRERMSMRLDGAQGQPSTVLDTPSFNDYFAGMTDDKIVKHIESWVDGQPIGISARPRKSISDKIKRLGMMRIPGRELL